MRARSHRPGAVRDDSLMGLGERPWAAQAQMVDLATTPQTADATGSRK